jgi:hypothetical protein
MDAYKEEIEWAMTHNVDPEEHLERLTRLDRASTEMEVINTMTDEEMVEAILEDFKKHQVPTPRETTGGGSERELDSSLPASSGMPACEWLRKEGVLN